MSSPQHWSEQLLQRFDRIEALNLQVATELAQLRYEVTKVQKSCAEQHAAELGEAREENAAMESKVKDSTARLESELNKQRQDVATLRRQLGDAEQASRLVSTEGTTTEAELQRLRSAYAGLERQLAAEKQASAGEKAHAWAAYKLAEDEDDEELRAPGIKKEVEKSLSSARKIPSTAMTDTGTVPSTPAETGKTGPIPSAASAKPKKPAEKGKKSAKKTTEKSSLQSRAERGGQSEQDELEAELEDLENDLDVEARSSSGSGSSNSIIDSTSEESNSSDLFEFSTDSFHFRVMTGSDGLNGIPRSYKAGEVNAHIPDLWPHIDSLVDLWKEETYDYDWQSAFVEGMRTSRSASGRVCVSSKLHIKGREDGKTRWRRGHEGEYACLTCAKQDLLCFTWVGEESTFLLLPLHPKDRKVKKGDDQGLRTWLVDP